MERDKRGRLVSSAKRTQKVYATGFKGFNPDMTCRGKQYSENAVFEELDKPKLCVYGIHFCKNPLDVLEYYDLVDRDGNPNAFAKVEALAPCESAGGKSVTSKLRIGAEIGIPGLCKAAVEYMSHEDSVRDCNHQSGDCDHQVQLGDRSYQAQHRFYCRQVQNGYGSYQAQSGDNSLQVQTGNYSRQAQSGCDSRQAQCGYCSQQVQTGNYSRQIQSGDYSYQTQSGNHSIQTQTGNYSRQASVGSQCAATATGKNSLVAVLGEYGRARGVKGCMLVLAEYDYRGVIKCVKATRVDGLMIKENVWYALKNGEFVEVNGDE